MKTNIRKNKTAACFLMVLLVMLFTAGCGGETTAGQETSGQADSTEAASAQAAAETEASQKASGKTSDIKAAAKASEDAEAFFGCWTYREISLWLCVNEDGTLEWYDEDGFMNSEAYRIDNGRLYVEGDDFYFSPDGRDGLKDSDGDELFRTEFPDFEASGEGEADNRDPEEEPYYEEEEEDDGDPADFLGVWEDSEEYVWLCIYGDGTYEWFNLYGSAGTGSYYMEDGALCLGNEAISYQLTDGVLFGSNETTMYFSQLPDPELMEANAAESAAEEEEYSYYEEESAEAPAGDASEFYGTWEYQEKYEWLVVYEDGTYGWYDPEGLLHEGYYEVSDGRLWISGNGKTFVVKFGGIVDEDDHLMYKSRLPDYEGNYGVGAEKFYGCWEDVSGGVWLEIYDNGEYLYMWDDGYGSAGYYEMDGDVLVLQSGTRYVLDSQTGQISGDDYVMFRSEMPEELRP